jgi:NAD(P)-dependent dehydrogenase (short-subunit alcohol dehydrogenase family)
VTGRLASKVVVVTGGGTGIGRAVAGRAVEDAGRGVRVNALVTGNADTPLYRSLLGVPEDGDLPEPAPNPTGRVAALSELASFVTYLLSDEAAFITGAALAIDEGSTA